MAKTFEKIDYRLRPAKNVERKMLVDILRKLEHIYKLKEYQYIGFGSTYFSDFRLFHRELGFMEMTSVEKVFQDELRFRFNKPFDCIDIEIGKSEDALPRLSWSSPTILWLDYEERLKEYMFRDIEQFCSAAPVGSVILITVNATPFNRNNLDEGETRVDKLRETLNEDNVPPNVSKKDLRKGEMANVYRRIITEKIEKQYLGPRNTRRSKEEELSYKQLANFRYQDNALMATFGGILISDEILNRFHRANFDDLPFVKTGDEEYIIQTPNLTFAEMRTLDRMLPSNPVENEVPVPEEHKEQYADIYRYFPRFIESQIP